MMKVILTGSSGLIGTAVAGALEQRGDSVTRLVRSSPAPGQARWDPTGGTIDAAALEGHDAVVNLAGAPLGDHRWTEAYKAEILDSRVKGTTLLARTLARLDTPPRVLASGSAVGYYGDRGDERLTEERASGQGFLASVAVQWEAATVTAREAGMRVAHLRTGIVLSTAGGALARLLLPFRLGLGGRLGSGRQWFSWITLDDEVAAILHLLDVETLSGPVNLAAPGPVTNADFTKAFGRAVHRPTLLPTPVFALKAAMGSEMVDAMLLGGQRVVPAALEASGFTFRHPRLDDALGAVLASSNP